MGTCCEAICKHRILFQSVQNLTWLPRGVPRGNKNVVKIAIFRLTHWLKHRLTRKLLKIDRYMLRGVWQALNCLSIYATYFVIVAGASPGETKMWAAFSLSWIMSKRINVCSNFFHHKWNDPIQKHTIRVTLLWAFQRNGSFLRF